MTVIEIAVDSTESALAAQEGGAQRVELCSALGEGGITPSLGLVRTVRASCSVSLFTIVRPRGGDFLYTEHEFRSMQEDIHVLGQEGIDGVVFGCLTRDGFVDIERTHALVECAGSMDVTFHRAFDMANDLEQSLEDVIAAGVKRVLTSGGEASAWAGRERLRRMVKQASGRATILLGGGVRTADVQELKAFTGASEFHSSLRRLVPGPMRFTPSRLSLGGPGADDFHRNIVLAEEVHDLVVAAGSGEESAIAISQRGVLPLPD